MSHLFSRLMSAASASYAVYALTQPRHLGNALEADPRELEGYDTLAQVFGVRDLAISALGVLGPRPGLVRAAMGLRMAMDLGDAAVLSSRVEGGVRVKVLAVTLGWAGLNAAALAADERRCSD